MYPTGRFRSGDVPFNWIVASIGFPAGSYGLRVAAVRAGKRQLCCLSQGMVCTIHGPERGQHVGHRHRRAEYEMLRASMDERMSRLWAASEAIALGWGGVTLVAKATGISRPTIRAGIREFEQLGLIPTTPATPPQPVTRPNRVRWRDRIRLPGGGRKATEVKDPAILSTLETLITNEVGVSCSGWRAGHLKDSARNGHLGCTRYCLPSLSDHRGADPGVPISRQAGGGRLPPIGE
jgi:hypothetical protein